MSVQSVLAAFGYPDTGFVEALLAKYGTAGSNYFTAVVQRNAPVNPAGCSWVYDNVVAHLVARGILVTAQSDGSPCAEPWQGTAGVTTVPGTPSAVTALTFSKLGITSAATIGTSIAGSSASFAASAVGSALGYATLGLGLLIGPLISLIQHHTQAVKTEDTTTCSVAQAANSTIPQIDQAVASGTVTVAQGLQALASLITSLNASLSTIQSGCNAACCYKAVLAAHLDFASQFYMDLSPLPVPPAAPGAYTPQTASAGVILSSYDSQNSPAGSPTLSGASAPVPATSLAVGTATYSSVPNIPDNGVGSTPASNSWGLILVGGIALVIAIAIFHKG